MKEELARRAVACKGWRWMPGMLALFLDEDEDPPVWVRERVQWVESPRSFWPVRSGRPVRATVYLPDLTDPATLGCLLALVREAWPTNSAGDCATDAITAEVAFADGAMVWTVICIHDGGAIEDLSEAPTEAEALVAALEAAE
jgi:hypothetical protein